MHKYVYPAVFTQESVGGYSISFPDVSGCFTQGENIVDGMYMAADALSLMLNNISYEDFPVPSDIRFIDYDKKTQFVSYVYCELPERSDGGDADDE